MSLHLAISWWQEPSGLIILASRVCSRELGSNLGWYFSGSVTSPLFRPHVTVGYGSPTQIALKMANLPEKRPEWHWINNEYSYRFWAIWTCSPFHGIHWWLWIDEKLAFRILNLVEVLRINSQHKGKHWHCCEGEERIPLLWLSLSLHLTFLNG